MIFNFCTESEPEKRSLFKMFRQRSFIPMETFGKLFVFEFIYRKFAEVLW